MNVDNISKERFLEVKKKVTKKKNKEVKPHRTYEIHKKTRHLFRQIRKSYNCIRKCKNH